MPNYPPGPSAAEKVLGQILIRDSIVYIRTRGHGMFTLYEVCDLHDSDGESKILSTIAKLVLQGENNEDQTF